MLEARVSAAVREVKPAVRVLDIRGEVNVNAEKPLVDAFALALQAPTRTVILNFHGLEYMNSAGIGLIVTLLIRAQRLGVRLLACCLNEHYREIFSLTSLDQAIPIFPDEARAVEGEDGEQ